MGIVRGERIIFVIPVSMGVLSFSFFISFTLFLLQFPFSAGVLLFFFFLFLIFFCLFHFISLLLFSSFSLSLYFSI